MISLTPVHLPDDVRQQLEAWQTEVDGAPDYAAKVALAKKLFEGQNTKSNITFKSVRSHLKQMCSGARRCVYCEDSAAD